MLSCVERFERAPQVDELSARRSRGILRGCVLALRGDAPTHALRARTGAQMRAAAPTRAHTHAHATRTARLCTLPPSFLADAHHLASRCGGCPLVLRHTRARRPRPLRASAPKRELARPKGRSPVNAADSRARRLLLVCDNSRCAARSQPAPITPVLHSAQRRRTTHWAPYGTVL